MAAAEKPPRASKNVVQGPIFDPDSKSYFELRIDNREGYWIRANEIARTLSYKGRKGRLALIKNKKNLEFIRENFRFNIETWIGMQFFCKYRKLIWVTGELQPLKSPGMWVPQWYRNKKVTCRNQNLQYMPVYLTNESKPYPVGWQASGSSKGHISYLVEYPAPSASKKDKMKPTDEQKTSADAQ